MNEVKTTTSLKAKVNAINVFLESVDFENKAELVRLVNELANHHSSSGAALKNELKVLGITSIDQFEPCTVSIGKMLEVYNGMPNIANIRAKGFTVTVNANSDINKYSYTFEAFDSEKNEKFRQMKSEASERCIAKKKSTTEEA